MITTNLQIISNRRYKIFNNDSYSVPRESLDENFRILMVSLGFLVGEEKTSYRFSAQEVLLNFKDIVGCHDCDPMYVNFPNQVLEASDEELILNANIHYISSFFVDIGLLSKCILPRFKKEFREKIEQNILKLRNVELFEDTQFFKDVALQLATSKTSLTETEKEELKFLTSSGFLDFSKINDISFKENLAIVLSSCTPKQIEETNIIKTPTDILRLAAACSGGDVSLSDPTRFISFPRKFRRVFLNCLEKCLIENKNSLEEMYSYREVWLRLGERIHPEYRNYKINYPVAVEAFRIIRSIRRIETYNSKLEQAFVDKDFDRLFELLSQKPGVFIRRTLHIVSLLKEKKDIDKFKNLFEIAIKTANIRILLQLHSKISQVEKEKLRVFLPKSSKTTKFFVEKEKKKEYDKSIISSLKTMIENEIFNRYKDLPKFKYFIKDDIWEQLTVSFSRRNANESFVNNYSRGSIIPLDVLTEQVNHSNIFRFFCYWKDNKKRVDIDLSAIAYDKDLNELECVSYYNLRTQSDNYWMYHSGDVVDGYMGSVEYIDIKTKKIPNKMKYIVPILNSFNLQPFNLIEECNFGWMLRKDNSKEIVFDPTSVISKIKVSSSGKIYIPYIIDIEEKKLIFADFSMNKIKYINNVSQQSFGIKHMIQSMMNISFPSLYLLLKMHMISHGIETEKEDGADLILSTNSNFDEISSKFLI